MPVHAKRRVRCAGLAWLSAQFPKYFESDAESGYERLWGSSQYMDYRGNDAGGIEAFWRQLNLTSNWVRAGVGNTPSFSSKRSAALSSRAFED